MREIHMKKILSFLLEFVKPSKEDSPMSSYDMLQSKHKHIDKSLYKNVKLVKEMLSESDDISYRFFYVATMPPTKACIVFIDNLIDRQVLESSVLSNLTQGLSEKTDKERAFFYSNKESLFEYNLTTSSVTIIDNFQNSVSEILLGNGIIFLDDYQKSISVDIIEEPSKKQTNPKTEKVVKGPQQGFVEDISVNISMLRRRVKSPNLVVKKRFLGRESKTEIRIAFMKNIANSSIVDELFIRLDRIDVDTIGGSMGIEEYISDSPLSLFNTTFYSERPDRIQSMILEGRIAIFCDGTPFTIVIPALVSDFFNSQEEYYVNFYFSTFNRLMGYFGAMVVMFLPSIYIAFTSYHQEMIPTPLALTIAGTRAGVPYPAFLEAFIMEIAFEALREASTKLPTQIGQAVSIVGALIIGQSAVEAGLVSPAVVIVVATTAIFSFTMPYNNFSLSLRLVRFLNMILAAVLGIFGVMTGALLISLTLVSLRSFGVPFMVPFSPTSVEDLKDWILRFPQWAITKRSQYIAKNNNTKKSENLKPIPKERRKGRE